MIRVKLLVRAGIALANALAAWWTWRTRPMDDNHQPREVTEPAKLPRTELPHEIPAAHAACDPDEVDTDLDPEPPGYKPQFSSD